MFNKEGITVSPLPAAGATIDGILLGLLILSLGSLIPIQVAMAKQLSDSLSSTRSKTKGQIVDVTSQDSFSKKAPYLLLGGLGAIAGISVYFFLPLSIITVNLGMMLTIFFSLLIGMIIGLTLIAFNLQRSLELLLVNTLLFLEKKSMKLLIVKNLSAHRESNKLTSLIYSLTLGSIIFVLVVSALEI